MEYFFYATLVITVVSMTSHSQVLEDDNFICDTCRNHVFIELNGTGFLKNNEYFTKYSEGYTAIGLFIQPTLAYFPSQNTKLSAGAHVLLYSGAPKDIKILPLLAIQHYFNPSLEVVIGNIHGTLHHKLEEPIYKYDLYFQDNVEYGAQLLQKSKKFQSDTWIQCKNFIERGDTEQEELIVGHRFDWKLYQGHAWKVSLPFQVLYTHKGGQINNSLLPVYSILNTVIGIESTYSFFPESSISFKPIYFYYLGPDSYDYRIGYESFFRRGHAMYLTLHGKWWNLYGMIGYWQGFQYISQRGEYLFLSISDYHPTFSRNRSLLTWKLGYDLHTSPSFNFQARTDFYFDVHRRNLAFSFGGYLIFNFKRKISKN